MQSRKCWTKFRFINTLNNSKCMCRTKWTNKNTSTLKTINFTSYHLILTFQMNSLWEDISKSLHAFYTSYFAAGAGCLIPDQNEILYCSAKITRGWETKKSTTESSFKVNMTQNFLSPSWKDLLKQYNNFFCSFSFSFFWLEIF